MSDDQNQKQPLATDPLGNEIFVSSVSEIEKYPKEEVVVLQSIQQFGFSGIFCTDGSSLSDFCLDAADAEKMSQDLGVPVSKDDYIVDICKRLAKKGTN